MAELYTWLTVLSIQSIEDSLTLILNQSLIAWEAYSSVVAASMVEEDTDHPSVSSLIRRAYDLSNPATGSRSVTNLTLCPNALQIKC